MIINKSLFYTISGGIPLLQMEIKSDYFSACQTFKNICFVVWYLYIWYLWEHQQDLQSLDIWICAYSSETQYNPEFLETNFNLHITFNMIS